MIEIRNIHKSFGDNYVLKGISTVFEQGKINFIIGKSGSGKTVFLKSIIGLHEVDEGEILYDNRIFSGTKTKFKKTIRKEIGMVFQGGALFDSETVEQNVMFPLEMFSKMKLEERRERVNFCLKKVNLLNANNLYPAEISGGMQKRVSIARAISLNPKYLFCDEPNSGLDPTTSILIDNLIKEISEEFNMTTIINTHDMNSVVEIGDKITYIHEGEKWWEGDNEEIFTSDNEELNKFVFASKKMKSMMQKKLIRLPYII